MRSSAELHSKFIRGTNLVVLVHLLPRYCQVLRMRIIQLDDYDYLLPTQLILNQYLANSTRINQIKVVIGWT